MMIVGSYKKYLPREIVEVGVTSANEVEIMEEMTASDILSENSRLLVNG